MAASSAGAPKDERALLGRLASLRKRVDALEAKRTASARRAVRDAKRSSSCVGTKWVPANYYGMSMNERAKVLGCDVRQMCIRDRLKVHRQPSGRA